MFKIRVPYDVVCSNDILIDLDTYNAWTAECSAYTGEMFLRNLNEELEENRREIADFTSDFVNVSDQYAQILDDLGEEDTNRFLIEYAEAIANIAETEGDLIVFDSLADYTKAQPRLNASRRYAKKKAHNRKVANFAASLDDGRVVAAEF